MPWPSPATFHKLKKVKVNKGMMMKKKTVMIYIYQDIKLEHKINYEWYQSNKH